MNELAGPLEATLRFPVGRKFCTALLGFRAGDDPSEILKHFIQEEHIPAYVEPFLYSLVHSLTKELAVRNRLASLAVAKKEVLESAVDVVATMYAEHTLRWSRALTASKDESMRSAEFAVAYSTLVSGDETRRFLSRLEKSYTMATLQLLQSKEHKQDELRRKHEAEITAALANANIPPRGLTARHVKDFELLEETFSAEFAEAQSVQKKEYKEFVVNMYKSKVVGQETPKKPTPSEMIDPDALEEEREGVIDQFSIYIGSQLKRKFNIDVYSGDVVDFCQQARHHSPRGTTITAVNTKLYGQSLKGVVGLTSASLLAETSSRRRLFELSQQSPEFHFDSLAAQLAAAQSLVDPQTGDVVITRHSNLHDIHVYFHLVTENSNTPEVHAHLLDAVRNVLQLAMEYDVSSLAIPLLLVEEDALDLTYTTNQAIRIAELVVKTVRTFLLQNTRALQNALQTLIFVLPPSRHPLFDKLRIAASNIRQS